MAFNLQKSEEPVRASKHSTFDLTKKDGQPGTEERKKSRSWIYAVVALLVISGAAWYFLQNSTFRSAPVEDKASVTPAIQDQLATDQDTNKATSDKGVLKNPVDVVDALPSQNNPKTNRQFEESAPGPSSAPTIVAAVFSAGSSRAQFSGKSIIPQIKDQLKTHPTLNVQVWGYASSEGDPVFNQAISQTRADAYKEYLIRKGITASRIVAEGKGIDNPIATNDTEAGRRRNRRVEVHYTN